MDGLGPEPLCVWTTGPAPKPSATEGPRVPRPSSAEGLNAGVRLKACDPKGKALMGYEGSRPKFAFRPKLWLLC